MTKQARHLAVKEILSGAQIGSQEDLRLELRKKGFRVTQATLSRDLKELGVGRVTSGDGGRYVLHQQPDVRRLRPLAGAEVVSVEANEALIVIHTLPGCANTVGEFIDMLKSSEIIGTVAGDNTLLVIPRSIRKVRHLVQSIKHKLTEE